MQQNTGTYVIAKYLKSFSSRFTKDESLCSWSYSYNGDTVLMTEFMAHQSTFR